MSLRWVVKGAYQFQKGAQIKMVGYDRVESCGRAAWFASKVVISIAKGVRCKKAATI